MLESGELLFTNKKSPRCPDGYMGLSIFLKPELHFIENLKFWWDNSKHSLRFIKDFEIEILIKLKDKTHDFGVPTTQVCEMAWDFQLKTGHIFANALIYNHLINIVDCFNRPLAQSGDPFKLKQNERLHIFKNARRIDMV